jgi:hypothetical protein
VAWEGELSDGGDVVMLTPTIWEYDPAESFVEDWINWHVQVDAQFGQRAKDIFSKIWPATAPVFDAVSLGIQTLGKAPGLWGPLGHPMSRPIGIHRDPNDPNGFTFNPTIIALTRESADFLVGHNEGLGAGIFPIAYFDDPHLQGRYSIYLQIEKLTGPATGWPDGSVLREESRAEVYVIFGNAKFHVPDEATLSRLYGGWPAVRVVADGALAAVDSVPDDGTLLREELSAPVWRMESGQKRHVTSPTVLSRVGGWERVRIVPDNALTPIPIGAPLNA